MMAKLHKRIPGAALLVVFGLMVHLDATSAFAQVRPTYTKNVDEPGRSPYQKSILFIPSSCSFNSVLYFCSVNFPAVPAGKRLVLEYVSMFVALSGGAPDSLRFQDQFNANVFWVQPTFTPRAINPNHFFLDRPVDVYYEAGQTPRVLMALSGPLSSAEMTVHGYLIDAAN